MRASEELLKSHALLGLRGRSCILDLIQNWINPNGPARTVVLPGMNRIGKLRSDPRVYFTDRVAEMAPIYAAVDTAFCLSHPTSRIHIGSHETRESYRASNTMNCQRFGSRWRKSLMHRYSLGRDADQPNNVPSRTTHSIVFIFTHRQT
jgi:hypothetical protein